MGKILTLGAAVVTGLGMTAGVASASTGTVTNTGPGSTNRVTSYRVIRHEVRNDNDVDVNNSNPQVARSGSAYTFFNTTVRGGVNTGTAHNDSLTSAQVTLNNSANTNTGSGGGAGGNSNANGNIKTTGPGSYNTISSRTNVSTEVNNDNDVDIHNNNFQYARSGSAVAAGNTRVGGVTTGNASNISTNQFVIRINN